MTGDEVLGALFRTSDDHRSAHELARALSAERLALFMTGAELGLPAAEMAKAAGVTKQAVSQALAAARKKAESHAR